MIKAVVFDFDGVILESAEIKTRAFRKLFATERPDRVSAIVDYHVRNMGVSRFVKFRHIFQNILGRPLPNETEAELGRKFSEIVLQEVLEAPFVPGAREFLDENCGKYDLFVASGTPTEELRHIAEKRGIAGRFKRIYGTPATKTDILRAILTDSGWNPGEVVFVGDAETDLNAAHDTGVVFVARIGPESSAMSETQHRLADLRGLAALISSL